MCPASVRGTLYHSKPTTTQGHCLAGPWTLDLDTDSCCRLPFAAVLLSRVGIWPGEFFVVQDFAGHLPWSQPV